jgi:inorganic triphosphatase YgiF
MCLLSAKSWGFKKVSDIETELKLRLNDPESLNGILAFLKGRASHELREERLKTTYYDTFDYRLLKSGLSYRLRVSAAGIMATVKADGQNDGRIHRRLEFNVPVSEDMPDIELFNKTPVGERLLAAKGEEALIPICATAFLRRIVDFKEPDGSEIEVAVDCGEIIAAEKTEPILEIELELKQGSDLALIRLGEELSRKFPLVIELESKLARALKLAGIREYGL